VFLFLVCRCGKIGQDRQDRTAVYRGDMYEPCRPKVHGDGGGRDDDDDDGERISYIVA